MEEFKGKASRFSYSISGVAFHERQVLLCRQEDEDLWKLPGCSVRFFESSIDTLKGIIKEDFGMDVLVERLIWISENSYEKDGTDYHELAFYYLIDFPDDAEIYNLTRTSKHRVRGEQLVFQWNDIDELQKLKIYPEFLKDRLKSIPDGIEHISLHK